MSDLTEGRTPRHPSLTSLLGYFAFGHLPANLAAISKPFHDLAHQLADTVPANPELTVALRKLLESKDCAVRAALG